MMIDQSILRIAKKQNRSLFLTLYLSNGANIRGRVEDFNDQAVWMVNGKSISFIHLNAIVAYTSDSLDDFGKLVMSDFEEAMAEQDDDPFDIGTAPMGTGGTGACDTEIGANVNPRDCPDPPLDSGSTPGMWSMGMQPKEKPVPPPYSSPFGLDG